MNEYCEKYSIKFQYNISKKVLDTVPDIKIHFIIKNEKPVLDNPDLFKETLIVSIGDTIAFIQDGYNGGLDRFGLTDGLEFYNDNENLIVVTGEGDKDFEAYVEFLGAENPNHSTYRGLKVGDSYDRMINLYGETDIEYDDGNSTSYFYGVNGYDNHSALIITIDNKTKLVTRFNVSLTF